VLPKELQSAYDKAQAAKKSLEEKQKALLDVQKIVENPVEAVTDNITKKIDDAANNSVEKAKTQATDNLQQALPVGPKVGQEQLEFDEALKKEAEALEKKAQ
jgi:hypothetical protein